MIDVLDLVKLLFWPLVMVSLLRLLVIVFIGDAENESAISKWIHSRKR